MKPNKLLILGVLALPIFLSACGGGSGSSANTATTINGIAVPPEPDATLNNATLAGVDVNENGVRDDVERKIATNSLGNDLESYNKAIAIAKAKLIIIDKPTPIDRLVAIAILKSDACAYDLPGSISPTLKNTASKNSFHNIIFNTQARLIKLNYFNLVLGGANGEELLCD